MSVFYLNGKKYEIDKDELKSYFNGDNFFTKEEVDAIVNEMAFRLSDLKLDYSERGSSLVGQTEHTIAYQVEMRYVDAGVQYVLDHNGSIDALLNEMDDGKIFEYLNSSKYLFACTNAYALTESGLKKINDYIKELELRKDDFLTILNGRCDIWRSGIVVPSVKTIFYDAVMRQDFDEDGCYIEWWVLSDDMEFEPLGVKIREVSVEFEPEPICLKLNEDIKVIEGHKFQNTKKSRDNIELN